MSRASAYAEQIRWGYALFSLWVIAIAISDRVHAVQVLSQYSQNYKVNGKPTVRNTIILSATESDASGSLQVGDYTVNITAIPPRFNYRYEEVGRVPRNTQLNINKACLVNDVDSFYSKQSQANSAQGILPQGSSNAAVQQNARRRLLQFDVVATGIAIAALVVGTIALGIASAAQADVSDLRYNVVGPMQNDIVSIQAEVKAQKAIVDSQQDQIALVANNSRLLLAGQVSQQQQLDTIGSTIDIIANQTTAQFAAINATLKRNADLINAQFTDADTRNKVAFTAVYDLISTMTGNLQTQVDSVIKNAYGTANSLQQLAISLTKQIRNIQIDRLTTQGYYQAVAKLDPALKPFTLGQGIPASSGLTGTKQRLLLERVNVNWVSNTTGNVYQIYNSQVSFYADSVYAIDNAAFVSNLDNLAILFGTNECRRSYVDADQTQTVPLTNPKCKVWAEIRTFSCSSQQLTPKFKWQLDFNNTITPSMCAGGVTPTAAPVQVIKKFDDMVQYFAGEPCKIQDGPYKMTTLRSGQAFQYPAKPDLCALAWKDQKYRAEARTGDVSIGYFVMLMLQQSFSAAYLDLFNLELQLYGRNPGGLKYDRKPNDYVPVSYNGTIPVYDGGAKPVDCTYTSWLGVDRQTVPIYSVEPIAGAIVSKGIRFSISGPQCTDPTKCYPVGETDVTANIDLNNDASHVLPGSFLMIGFLEDFAQGIWDVPSRSLTASSSTSERAYTPSYIMMPPGTTSTFDLVDWISRNNDLFDPEKGGVSPGIYRFETARDIEGFPYCSVPGGEPVNGYQTTTRGCVNPYSYLAMTGASTSYQASNATALYAGFTSQCKVVNTVLIYSSRQNELITPTLNSSRLSPAANVFASANPFFVSFLYYKDQYTADNGAVDAIEIATDSGNIRFGVNALGIPRVIITGPAPAYVLVADTSLTELKNVDVRNGVWHHVYIEVTSGTFAFKIYVDGSYLGNIYYSLPRINAGARPFVRAISDITLNSAGAKVIDALIAPGTLTLNQVQNYRDCALTSAGGGRCSNSTENVIIARRNVTSTEGVVCASDSVLLYSESGFNAIYPRNTTLMSNSMQNSWSLTMWIRSKQENGLTNYVVVRAGRGSVEIRVFSGNVQVVVNNVAFATPVLNDNRAHFVTATFSATSLQAQVYVDSVLISTQTAAALTLVASSTFTNTFPSVSMIKSYAYVLTSAQQNVEGLCQVSSTIGAFGFIPPVGICTSVPGSNYGYCRESMMCRGHCGAYSAIDKVSGTFTPLVNECDDGWAPPLCTSRCGRIDPLTGECLDRLGKSAVGLTPAGVLCPLASNFKLSTVASTKLLGASPRFWQYTVSVGVPAGVITNVIETGACPLATITPNIDGSFLVNLQNNNNAKSIVNVLYAPQGVFTGGQACESPCCSLALDAPVTIAANSVFSFAVPAANCGNVSVIVQQAVNTYDPFSNTTVGSTQECSRFEGNQIKLILSTASNQAVPTNVQSQIQVSQNTVAVGIKNTADALGLQLVNLLSLGAESNFQGEGFKTTLALQAQAIRESVFNPINFTSSLPPYSIQDSVDNLNNVTAAGNAALSRTVALFNANENTRQNLEVSAREQSANLSKLINETDRQLALTIQAYQDSLIKFPNGGMTPTFVNIIRDIGKSAAEIVNEGAHLGKSFIDSALDIVGLPGKLLGGLGNLIGGFVKFLLYYLIVKLIGAAFSAGAPAASAAFSQGFSRFRPSSKYKELPLSEPNPIRAGTGAKFQASESPRSGSSAGATQMFTGARFIKGSHRNRMH